MVQIGEIYLGGKEGHPQSRIVYNSGVAFSLTEKSPIEGIFEFESGWEVELQKNNQHIVAKCAEILQEEQILRLGFECCQQYLDLLSVSQKKTMGIDRPGQEYILLINKGDRSIARITTNADLKIRLEATATVRDKDGNVVEQPPPPQPVWLPAYRYYRISQAGSDLYDAYRNLYLAFESLLQEIAPINSGEKETEWLLRVLTEIGRKVPLQDFVPAGKDPIPYIAGIYYEHFRCKTFHAKNRNYILPHEWADAEKLSEAYGGLLRIWRQVATVFTRVPGGGGGVTYQGFMSMMDPVAKQGFEIQFTDDPSKDDPTDTKISPLGHTVFSTTNNIYVRDFRPGIVLFKGELEDPTDIGLELIHRVGHKSGETLLSVTYYEDGIKPLGIDLLESYETIRLVNKSSPKTIF